MQMTLEYWHSLANQIILISSLLSGFSIAIVSNLLISKRNDKVSNRLLKAAATSAACFLISLFSMTKIYMMTTPGGVFEEIIEADFAFPRLIGFIAFVLGLFALSAIIALSGWTKSKKMGTYTTVVAAVTLLLILLTLVDFRF
jgi:uncharacterized membrane protein YozB (DUF420 family)